MSCRIYYLNSIAKLSYSRIEQTVYFFCFIVMSPKTECIVKFIAVSVTSDYDCTLAMLLELNRSGRLEVTLFLSTYHV